MFCVNVQTCHLWTLSEDFHPFSAHGIVAVGSRKELIREMHVYSKSHSVSA